MLSLREMCKWLHFTFLWRDPPREQVLLNAGWAWTLADSPNHSCSCVYFQVYTTLFVCSTGGFCIEDLNLQFGEDTKLFLLLQEWEMKGNALLPFRLACVPLVFALLKYSHLAVVIPWSSECRAKGRPDKLSLNIRGGEKSPLDRKSPLTHQPPLIPPYTQHKEQTQPPPSCLSLRLWRLHQPIKVDLMFDMMLNSYRSAVRQGPCTGPGWFDCQSHFKAVWRQTQHIIIYKCKALARLPINAHLSLR